METSFIPHASALKEQTAALQVLRELRAVYSIVIAAGLAGGAAYGVASALAVMAAAGPLQAWPWVAGFFAVFLAMVSWTIFACLFAAPVLAFLIPRGVMTSDRLAWLPGRRMCGLLGAGLGLAATGAAALITVAVEAIGWGEGLVTVHFVALSIGLMAAGISLGLMFHAHRAGCASND